MNSALSSDSERILTGFVVSTNVIDFCSCFRCITVCYVAPSEDVFFGLNGLKKAASDILQTIVDHHLDVSLSAY